MTKPAVVRRRMLGGLLAAIVLLLPGGHSAAGQTPARAGASDDPEVQGAIRLFSAWLDSQIAYRALPGVAVGVVAGDDLVWTSGFGLADVAAGVPMRSSTRFRMASHSKLFTATAIMQLREQGKLRLDDPVAQHLPWFRVTAAPSGGGRLGEPSLPYPEPAITIEHLLTHSSGLPREAAAHWTTLEFPTDEQLRTLLPERQAAFPPETRWKYSNLAYTLAGKVVEAVSGQVWADYVQQHITGPLGMTSTSVDRNVDGLAVGYGRRMPDGSRDIVPFVDARAMAAATGITSTVEDMARFVSAQFRTGSRGDDRILSTGALREMHRVRMLENDWTRGSGIGFAVSRVKDKVYVGHGGGYPGYTTQTTISLDDRVGVIVLTNTNDSNPSDIATKLMSTVGAAVAKATAKPSPKVPWNPAWSRFAGLYRGRGGDAHVVELHERLVIITPHAPGLDEQATLEPLGDGRFRLMAPSGGGAIGEVVRFVEEDGRIVRMITGDSYVERVADR